MGLLNQLLMTAFVALLIYVLVAKLVSIATAGREDDGNPTGVEEIQTVVAEDVKLERRFRVKSTKKKKKTVQFAVEEEEIACKVDKFEAESKLVERRGGGVVVPEGKSGLESPEVGSVADAVVLVGPRKEIESAIEEKSVGEEKIMDCLVDDKVDDCEIKRELIIVKEFDDESDGLGVKDVGEDQGCEIERELKVLNGNKIVDGGIRMESDYQSEPVGILERELNGNENVDGELGREFDDQCECIGVTEVGGDQGSRIEKDLELSSQGERVMFADIGEDQGSEIGKQLNVDEIADEEIAVKLVDDVAVDKQTEQIDIIKFGGDQGEEIEKEENENEKADHETEHARIMEIGEDQQSGIQRESSEGNEVLICDENDDWEGIERSELEKEFATAANYAKDDQLLNLGSDVQMQLYGLRKVAMEGPCREAQPMALKVSARAKWNAWQKLGNMSPEVAMEHYIGLLSDKVPGWSEKDYSTRDGELDSSEAAMPIFPDPHMTTFPESSQEERKVELTSSSDGDVVAGSSNSVNQDKMT